MCFNSLPSDGMENNDNKQPLADVKAKDEWEESVTLTKSDYDKLKDADSKRRGQSSENQRLAALAEVVKDNTKFYKLLSTDRAKADFVAQHYGMNSEQMKETLDKYYNEHPDEKKAPSEEDLYEKMSAKQDEKEAKKTLNSFIKEKGFSKDSKFGKAFMEEIDDYMDGKKRTEEIVDKASRKAYAYIKGLGNFTEELQKVESKLPWAWTIMAWARKWAPDLAVMNSKRQQHKATGNSILDFVHAQKK